jgi:alpha-L-fucosidase
VEHSDTTQTNDPRLAWYREAKFGLFLHWGAYSVAGVEASWPIMAPELSQVMFGTTTSTSEAEYTAFPARFNPVDFDAAAWVHLAQAAGMRYIVLTSKHHDGFCMFDAPGTDYKITKTPFGRDICLELSQACAAAGMPLGFYYSPPDMHHPGYRDTSKPATSNWLGEPKRREWGEYLDYMESHIRHLLTGYGRVSILWFDGLVNHAKYDPPRFHKLIHELSPETLVNDRLGDDYDFITPEQFIPKKGIPVRTGKPPSSNDPSGDGLFRFVTRGFKIPGLRGFLRSTMKKYASGELELTPVIQEPYPSLDRFQPWETCMTMGQSWAYNPHETTWKVPGQLVRNLVSVVGRGGNYLLNIGPTARGAFPPEALARLGHVGKWMGSHHASIYGSTYSPLQGMPWGTATRKDDRLFLHIFDWPDDGRLVIDPFPGSVRTVSLLNGGPLEFKQFEKRLEISLPSQAPDPDVSVLVASIDPAEEGWHAYSPAKPTKIPPGEYLRKQAITSAWINALINGIIAFFSYRSRGVIPALEGVVDILITVFILAFLVSWISVWGVRQEVIKGNLDIPASTRHPWLPRSNALAALILTLLCVVLFGGLLSGLLTLLVPNGLNHWAYFAFKTVYTGLTAAVAVFFSVVGVLGAWWSKRKAASRT